MVKIKYISNPYYDDKNRYGKYAKEQVKVVYEKDNKDVSKNLYLDDEELYRMLTNYEIALKKERNHINSNHFDKRIKYNAIMAGIGVAIMFTGLGLGNVLVSLGINSALVSTIIPILVTIFETIGFYHVNKDKFYYSKKEIKKLDEIKEMLEKCANIERKINSLDKNELININFRREQIDNKNLRYRNYERNVYSNHVSRDNIKEAEKRINLGVKERLRNNKQTNYQGIATKNKLSLRDNLYKYRSNFKLLRINFGRKVGNWLQETFDDNDNYQNKQEENYMIRGEKRNRR